MKRRVEIVAAFVGTLFILVACVAIGSVSSLSSTGVSYPNWPILRKLRANFSHLDLYRMGNALPTGGTGFSDGSSTVR